MIEVYVNSLSVREQFFVAMSISVTGFAFAAALREMFKDSHVRMAARIAGIASILPLLSFGWRSTNTIEKLQTELVARKHDGTEISGMVNSSVYELETPSGIKVAWIEQCGGRYTSVPNIYRRAGRIVHQSGSVAGTDSGTDPGAATVRKREQSATVDGIAETAGTDF